MVNVAHIHREVKRVVAGLRITDVYAVQQDCHLLKVAAAHAHISLRAYRPTLAYIYAYCVFQYVVY